jgi:hypothetical protein
MPDLCGLPGKVLDWRSSAGAPGKIIEPLGTEAQACEENSTQISASTNGKTRHPAGFLVEGRLARSIPPERTLRFDKALCNESNALYARIILGSGPNQPIIVLPLI